MKRILCAGCTGLIGGRLVPRLLDAGYHLRVLTRNPQRANQGLGEPDADRLEFHAWDATRDPVDDALIADCTAAINLTGAGIANRRWTQRRKRVLHDSRIPPTRAFATAAVAHDLPLLINASAIGWYGVTRSPVDEAAPAGSGWLAELTAAWEAALVPASRTSVRSVRLRIGAVLAPEGGALAKMTPPPVLPVARLGSGRQPFAWIHIEDVVGMILSILDDESWSGPINAVVPSVDDHATVMRALARATGKPLFPVGVPAWALRLVLGEMAGMLLDGAAVVPRRAQELGYRYRYPDIQSALGACFESKGDA